MASSRFRFGILISLVSISGFSQGMLLPLIAIILESNGVSSTINGLHATGLYIGVLIASPFMEKPLKKIGYKPMILIGGALVFTSLFFFTFWESLWFWFILRLTVGIGDHILHFGTQTWITSTSAEDKRGRNIALYGLSFGAGFAVGPLMTRLLVINEALPFIAASLLSALVWSGMFFVRNEFPEDDFETQSTSSIGRFIKAGKIAWVALLLPLAYGFLEAALHGSFPVYGMRIGHEVGTLSLIIPFFAIGSLISQLPIGVLSDKIGRKKMSSILLAIGIISFFLASIYEDSVLSLFILFTLAGMGVGSIFSLGISYMTDLLPKSLLPAGNILCGITFSIGSIIGPYLGGLFIEYFPNASFFHVITTLLLIIFVILTIQKEPLQQKAAT